MGSIWTQSLKEEMNVSKVRFSFNRPELLLQPQWNIPPLLWLLYRIIIVLYTVIWCFYSALIFSSPKWLLFLSHIVYCIMGIYYLLALCNLVGAVFQVRIYYRVQRAANHEGHSNTTRGSMGPFPLPPILWATLRLQWCLHTFVSGFSVTVTFLYWMMDFPIEKHPLSAFNVNMHAGNSFQVLLDLVLSSTPVHLVHYVHLFLAGCLYILFAVLYWLCGGTNLSRKPYIYKALDFGGCPLVAAFAVCGFLCVCLPISHFLVWNVCFLRKYVVGVIRGASLRLDRERWWAKVGGGEDIMPITLTGRPASLFIHEDPGVGQPLLSSFT